VDHPLYGAFEKLRRARKHLNELETEIGVAPLDAYAIRFEQEFKPDTSTIEVTLQGLPKFPVRWGLIAADALNNLRAALNYLTWELAVFNLAAQGIERAPLDDTQFPIAYRRWKGVPQKQVADLRPDHARRIKAIQPNGASHLAQFPEHLLRDVQEVRVFTNSHLLTHLAVLTNDDKHRILLPTAFVAGETQINDYVGINCTVNHINHFLQVGLENDAKWAEVQVTPTGGGEPKVQVNDRIDKTRIEFGSPPFTAADALWQIRDVVANIVTSFWSDLDSGESDWVVPEWAKP